MAVQQMNVDKLKSKLNSELNDSEINTALVKISLFSPELEQVFEQYIETGELPKFTFEGWNFEKIMTKTGCSAFQSFFTMDNLMKNDEYRKYFEFMNFGKK